MTITAVIFVLPPPPGLTSGRRPGGGGRTKIMLEKQEGRVAKEGHFLV